MRLFVSKDNRSHINNSNSSNDDNPRSIVLLNQKQKQRQQQYDKVSLFSKSKLIYIILFFGVSCCTTFCFVSFYWYETIITLQHNNNNHHHQSSLLLNRFVLDDRIESTAADQRQNTKNENRMLSLVTQQSKSNIYNETNNNDTELIRRNETPIDKYIETTKNTTQDKQNQNNWNVHSSSRKILNNISSSNNSNNNINIIDDDETNIKVVDRLYNNQALETATTSSLITNESYVEIANANDTDNRKNIINNKSSHNIVNNNDGPSETTTSDSSSHNTTNNDDESNDTTNQQQQQQQQQLQEQPVYQKIQNFNQYKGTLNCTMYGGPYNPSTVIDSMIYWKYVPADYAEFDSPLRKKANNDNQIDVVEEEEETTESSADDIAKDDEEVVHPTNTQSQLQYDKQYLTFELDNGGFNNIRMAFETVIAIAIASGRILVLPPKYIDWYDSSTEQYYGLNEIFVLQETKSFQYITFDTFLQTVVINQQYVRHPITNAPIFPPKHNKTNWDNKLACYEGHHKGYGKILWKNWFHKYIPTLQWNTEQCIGAFPSSRGPAGVQRVNETLHNILGAFPSSRGPAGVQRVNETLHNILYYEKYHYEPSMKWTERKQLYSNHPTDVNRTSFARLRELLVDRTKLCIYDTYYQNIPILHIHSEGQYRMLTQYYSSLFIENYQFDLHIKRYIRDNVRYNDNIQCLAGQVIETIQQQQNNNKQSSIIISDGSTNDKNSNKNSTIIDFDTIHFRRDDFETIYPEAFISIDEMLLNNTYYMIDDNRTVYIATDEKDLSIFNPLRQNYNILFLKDCLNQHNQKINTLYYGPIDQSVAAYGTTFIGTLMSTFTGYINRLRGYHSTNNCNTDTTSNNVKCYNVNTTTGRINSYYAVAENSEFVIYRTMMFYYSSVDNPSWYREFPIGWRDIDHDFILITSSSTTSSSNSSISPGSSNISNISNISSIF